MPYAHDRIRVAYVSADFREHPVSYLMAGVFACHDRTRFEVTGISLRPDDGSPTSRSVRAALGNVVDVLGKTDAEIAALLHGMEIDIAVDLMGHTLGGRTAIFAHRPAPVQVNSAILTSGAPYMDYLIADRVIVPPGARRTIPSASLHAGHLSGERRPAPRRLDQARASGGGIAETGFAFAVSNATRSRQRNSSAGRPAAGCDGQRVVLYADYPWCRATCARARRRGVDPARLALAGTAYADIWPGCIWRTCSSTRCRSMPGRPPACAVGGVPVLTRPGDAFAARMAASLLTMAGLPELIAANADDYSALALKLATTPSALADVRARLSRNRTNCALFDTQRFCRNLESAYRTMRERCRRGEAPAGFDVEPG